MRKTIFLALLLAATPLFAGVTITIQNNDSAGQGFNDPTPATPIGGNPGTTLGEQRLNAFKFAAGLWGNVLDSKVPIVIRATFSPINSSSTPCTASSAILGQAGPAGSITDFTNAPLAHVAYPIALANALAGTDLNGPANAEITAQFNSLVDNATCLGTTNWYYGFDGNHGKDIDLVEVLLHEFAHGFGFSGNTSTLSGNMGNTNTPSIFEVHAYDNVAGLRWNQMTSEQRLLSMVNTGHLAWDGPLVKAHAATYLKPITILTVNAPSSIAHRFDIGTAAFGESVAGLTLTSDIVPALDAADAVGPSTTDGCSAYTNASAVAGKWALVDRGPTNGNCTFVLKAQNAQAAGAIGLIVADNRKDTCFPPGMSGTDTSVTIPVISITQDDGATLRAATGVNATLHVVPTELAGATTEGYAKLYAPCTISAGSSIYHFDTTATPNLLMEPNINDDLNHTLDLTVDYLRDIGWPVTAPQGRTILRRR